MKTNYDDPLQTYYDKYDFIMNTVDFNPHRILSAECGYFHDELQQLQFLYPSSEIIGIDKYDGIVTTNNGNIHIREHDFNENIINSYGIFDFIIAHGTGLNFMKRDYNIINQNYWNLYAIGNMDALEPNGMLILHGSWDIISIDVIIDRHA